MRRKTTDYSAVYDVLTEVAEGVRATRSDVDDMHSKMDVHSAQLHHLQQQCESIRAESAAIREMLTTPARWVA